MADAQKADVARVWIVDEPALFTLRSLPVGRAKKLKSFATRRKAEEYALERISRQISVLGVMAEDVERHIEKQKLYLQELRKGQEYYAKLLEKRKEEFNAGAE